MFILKIPSQIELSVLRVWFHLENLDREKPFPKHIFSPLRGTLGASLKSFFCLLKHLPSCQECPCLESCVYGMVFETVRPKNAPKFKKYPFLPHPFAITPIYKPGESSWKLGLTLVGEATKFFPHFIAAIRRAGEMGIGKHRVPFKILKAEDHFTGKSLLYGESSFHTPETQEVFPTEDIKTIKINFLTPLSVRFNEKIVGPREFEFHILIRNLLRRISALSFFFCGKELELPYREIIELATSVEIKEKQLKFYKIERYSARKKTTMPLKGFKGWVIVSGNLRPFFHLLKIGELVHVGKNISFGFGGYSLEILE